MTQWFDWGRKDRRHRWLRLVGPCASMGECSRALAGVADRLGIPARNQVIVGGDGPAREPGGQHGGDRGQGGLRGQRGRKGGAVMRGDAGRRPDVERRMIFGGKRYAASRRRAPSV